MLRNFIMFLLFIYFCSWNIFGQSKELTLQECFSLALKNNIDIEVVKYSPKIADTDITGAKSPYDIFLNSYYEYSKTDSSFIQERRGIFSVDISKRFLTGTQVSLGYGVDYTKSDFPDFERDLEELAQQLQLGNIDVDLEEDRRWISSVNLKMSQSLLRNFGISTNEAFIKAAERNKKAAEYEVQAQINQILAQVERTYWNWVLVLENIKVTQESIEKAKLYKKLVENKSGRIEGVLPSNVSESALRLLLRQSRLIQLQRAKRNAEDRLRRLIYPFTPDNPAQSGWQEDFTAPTAVNAQFQNLERIEVSIERAVENRPEVKQIKEQLKASDFIIERNKNLMLPSLDAFGGVSLLGEEDDYGQAFQDTLDGDHWRWNVGVALEIPIGNLAAKSRLKKSITERAQLEALMHRTQYDISLELRTARHALQEAEEKYQNDLLSLKNAQDRLSSLERRYDNPLKGDFNLLFFLQDAELNQTDVKIALNQSLFEYKIAITQLKLAEARYIQDVYAQSVE